MNTNECELCGRLFWCDDEDQKVCPDCLEQPVEDVNRQRSVEAWASYIESLVREKR